MKFIIHYIEKGDGKRIRGTIYNGKRRMTINAKDETSAIQKLYSQYVKNGIKAITKVDRP